MPPETSAHSHDPTRTAWLDQIRSEAEHAIAKMWRSQHRTCLLSTSPRSLDPKGRPTGSIERKGSRLRAFESLRAQILSTLTAADDNLARLLIEHSEFASSLRLAFSPDEASMRFAEFLLAGDNAWSHGNAGEQVLWIDSWHE